MPDSIQIIRYHIDLESRQIAVQCRRYDERTGSYLPSHPNTIRHLLPVSEELLAVLDASVRPQLEADLGEVSDAHPAAVTSALHHLRELRHEATVTRRGMDEEHRLHRERIAAARAEHEEILRRRSIAAEEVDELARRKKSG